MAGVIIGLKDIYYAILLQDNGTGATYSTPVKLSKAINAKISPKSNSSTLYADDGPDEVCSSLGEIDVEIGIKELDLASQAALLGHTLSSSTGVLTKRSTDVAPYVALGYRSVKSNGKYRYVWLLKGKFSLPEENLETAKDTPNFQTPTLKATFVRRDFDNAWQKTGDEEAAGWVGTTKWFASVTA